MFGTLKFLKNSKIQFSSQKILLQISFLKIKNFNDVHLRAPSSIIWTYLYTLSYINMLTSSQDDHQVLGYIINIKWGNCKQWIGYKLAIKRGFGN